MCSVSHQALVGKAGAGRQKNLLLRQKLSSRGLRGGILAPRGRHTEDAGDSKIVRLRDAEIAVNLAKIRPDLVLPFTDGLEYDETSRQLNVDQCGLPLGRSDFHAANLNCTSVVDTPQKAKPKLHRIDELP